MLKNELTFFQYQLKKHYDEKLRQYVGKKIVNADGSFRKGVDVPRFQKEAVKLSGSGFLATFNYSTEVYSDGKCLAWCHADVHCGEAFGFHHQRQESSLHIFTTNEGTAEVVELNNDWVMDHPIYAPEDVLRMIADAKAIMQLADHTQKIVPSSFRQWTKGI